MEITLCPETFINSPDYETISIDDLNLVKYRNSVEIKIQKINLEMNMFVIVLDGKKLVYNRETVLNINSGEAFFVPRGSFIIAEVLSELDSYESLIFFFDDDYIDLFIQKYLNNTNSDLNTDLYRLEIFKLELDKCYTSSIKSIIPYFINNSVFKRDLFKLKFEEMLLVVLSTTNGSNFLNHFKRLSNNNLYNLAYFMEQNYTKPYSLMEFATRSGKSLSDFKRKFNEIYYTTPKNWINNRRLDLAYTLLLNSNISVSELCYKVGFTNLSYFIQLFKKKYGVTPKKLQKD